MTRLPERVDAKYRIYPIAALLISILVLVGGAAHSACGNEHEICASGSPWYSANGAHLRIEDPSTNDYGVFVFAFPERLSMMVDTESRYEGKNTKGKILLVDGRVMLTKGLELEKGYEIDALDGAVLFYQLSISLLAQAFPEGPQKFKDSLAVDVTENTRGIKIATSSASGFFAAPWKLKGDLKRKSPEAIAFSLAFQFRVENSPHSFTLSGEWKKTAPAPALDPSLSLEGWNAYTLGPISIKQDGGTILDYGAQARPTTLRTLGELQESIRKNEASPNRADDPDASKSGARGSR